MSNVLGNRQTIGWILLTALGLTAGIVGALFLGGPIEKVVGMMLVTPAVTCLVGAALGASQWPHMRRVLKHPYRWIVASCLGLGAGLAIGVVVVEQGGQLLTGHAVNLGRLGILERALSLAIVGAISGLCLGAAESLVLRWENANVRRWVATTAMALGVGFPVSSIVVDTFFGGVTSPAGGLLFVSLAGLALGVATARPLKGTAG